MGSSSNKPLLFKKYLGVRLFFLTIPKPLKQSTLFKKDDPFRSPRQSDSYALDLHDEKPLEHLHILNAQF